MTSVFKLETKLNYLFIYFYVLSVFFFLAKCGYCYSDVLLDIGGDCYGGIDSALRVWGDYTLAYYFWVQVATNTGPFFCLPGSGAGDHQLSGVSRIKWRCMYYIHAHFFKVVFGWMATNEVAWFHGW